MSDPHLANWLFLLPAFLLGATIARGALSRLAQCFLALSASSRLSESEAEAVG